MKLPLHKIKENLEENLNKVENPEEELKKELMSQLTMKKVKSRDSTPLRTA